MLGVTGVLCVTRWWVLCVTDGEWDMMGSAVCDMTGLLCVTWWGMLCVTDRECGMMGSDMCVTWRGVLCMCQARWCCIGWPDWASSVSSSRWTWHPSTSGKWVIPPFGASFSFVVVVIVISLVSDHWYHIAHQLIALSIIATICQHCQYHRQEHIFCLHFSSGEGLSSLKVRPDWAKWVQKNRKCC